jgi:hypothetical protein
MTDEVNYYKRAEKEFSEHHAVNHSAGEYVRDDAHTNTLEGYFSIFKRGMKGCTSTARRSTCTATSPSFVTTVRQSSL